MARRATKLNDIEWASLPLEIRMWCIDQARRVMIAGSGTGPFSMTALEPTARDVALMLTRRPVVNETDDGSDPRNAAPGWKSNRGLA